MLVLSLVVGKVRLSLWIVRAGDSNGGDISATSSIPSLPTKISKATLMHCRTTLKLLIDCLNSVVSGANTYSVYRS